MGPEDFRPARVASRHQGRPRSRADRLRNVEIAEATTFAGQLLDVRSLVGGRGERMEIRPAGVVEEDDDDEDPFGEDDLDFSLF